MVHPRVEGKAERRETFESFAELRFGEHPRTRNGFVHALIRIPRRRKSNRMKAPATHADMRREDRLDPRAEQ